MGHKTGESWYVTVNKRKYDHEEWVITGEGLIIGERVVEIPIPMSTPSG